MTHRTLTRTEFRWAEAAYGTIFPRCPDAGFPLGIVDLDLEGFLAQIRSELPWLTAMGIRLAIWVVALAPLFVLGRLTTIVGLGDDERLLLLNALFKSRFYVIRQAVVGLKATGAFLWAGDPRVRARICGEPPRLALPLPSEELITLKKKPNAA